ncbi:DNA excision repair protein ERCC-3 [Monoraphidium neglectum]|uniref:DNA excision repair protein ERCC-3 n=1 Tax=Monoraphidium neglectum TaxID=145388 RepID=A0A0D2M757_9CHLO|nr:DNA excision repair protein ERCC-3 [Monoraphidium neglectum]KIY91315.1 DNA excision repair protein ERCC-3 [Monoraphidium neglectum]|eukprot:XP_013890335.1 DNA excision repair protein ERCC-3 [Monoraphidium neglectum]
MRAYDFLIAVAEPVCRPEGIHEYVLTPHSLYAAVSVGLETATIVKTLNTLSKVAVTAETARFIKKATQNYGKAKMVLKKNKFWVESAHKEVLDTLLADPVIAEARTNSLGLPGDGLVRSKALRERAAHSLAAATQAAIKGPPLAV